MVEEGTFNSLYNRFKLEEVLSLKGDILWSIRFLQEGAMLLSQFGGKLYVVRNGKLGDPMVGTPEVARLGRVDCSRCRRILTDAP